MVRAPTGAHWRFEERRQEPCYREAKKMAASRGTAKIGTCFTKLLSIKRPANSSSCHPFFLSGARQRISPYKHSEGIHKLCCGSTLNSRENKNHHNQKNNVNIRKAVRKCSNKPPATCTQSTNPTKSPKTKVAFYDKLKDGPSLQDFIISSNFDDNVSSHAIAGEDFSTADSVPYVQINAFGARNRKGTFLLLNL